MRIRPVQLLRGKVPEGIRARALRDANLKDAILKEYDENYRCYGARKMWLELRSGRGIDVARCTVERLMRTLGLQGARRGTVKRTTVPDPAATRAQDLVKRDFKPLAPNKLWVADFERHEALLNRAVMEGHRRRPVVAGG